MVELDQFKYRISGYDAQIENIKQSLDLDSKKKRIEELEADMERLKVLYYDSFTTHDSIGVKRKLRFRSFNGYLKEEERKQLCLVLW